MPSSEYLVSRASGDADRSRRTVNLCCSVQGVVCRCLQIHQLPSIDSILQRSSSYSACKHGGGTVFVLALTRRQDGMSDPGCCAVHCSNRGSGRSMIAASCLHVDAALVPLKSFTRHSTRLSLPALISQPGVIVLCTMILQHATTVALVAVLTMPDARL
jgi:hypothetical protein